MATPAALADTVQGLLGALPNIDIYTGTPPLTVPQGRPYVIYYPNPGAALRERLTAGHTLLRWDMRAVVCGWDPIQLLVAADTVREALTGIRIDTDPTSSPLNEVNSGSTVLDTGTVSDTAGAGLPRYSYTLQYRLHTRR